MLGNLKTFFTNYNVPQVAPTDVQDLVNHFDSAKDYARKHKGMLPKFFAWAILVKCLRTDNPFQKSTRRQFVVRLTLPEKPTKTT